MCAIQASPRAIGTLAQPEAKQPFRQPSLQRSCHYPTPVFASGTACRTPLSILPDSNVFHSRRYGAATSPIFHPHYRPSSAAISPLLLRLFPRLSERNCRYCVKLPSLCRYHAENPAYCLTPKTHLCAGGIPLCTRPCIPRTTPSPPPSVTRSFRHKTTARRRNGHTRARRFQRAETQRL